MLCYPFDFGGRVGAAKHQITMRKTAETVHDIPVADSVFQFICGDVLEPIGRFRVELFETSDAFVLGLKIFGVFERHVEESAFNNFEFSIDSHRDAVATQGERTIVVRERLRLTSINISRELIERDDECKRTLRCQFPTLVLAPACLFEYAGKAFSYALVK